MTYGDRMSFRGMSRCIDEWNVSADIRCSFDRSYSLENSRENLGRVHIIRRSHSHDNGGLLWFAKTFLSVATTTHRQASRKVCLRMLPKGRPIMANLYILCDGGGELPSH